VVRSKYHCSFMYTNYICTNL